MSQKDQEISLTVTERDTSESDFSEWFFPIIFLAGAVVAILAVSLLVCWYSGK